MEKCHAHTPKMKIIGWECLCDEDSETLMSATHGMIVISIRRYLITVQNGAW